MGQLQTGHDTSSKLSGVRSVQFNALKDRRQIVVLETAVQTMHY